MRPVLLLLLGAHLVYAGSHSFKAFYTSTTGVTNYPEFTIAALVDNVMMFHYDSIDKQVVPRTEWMKSSEGPEYWKQQTDISVGAEQDFKNNIQVAMGRFNQTGGVHTWQFMVGCQLNDDGSTRGHYQYGYDGEDFISFDKNTFSCTAAKDQAVITKNKWEADKAGMEYRKTYLENECIEWLRKYVGYGRNSLERKDAPVVFLLQKDPSSPVLCQATGFYPSNIMMTWQKNKQEQHEDVEVGTTLPNVDGTFQKTVTLSVKPEEWKNNKDHYRCVVQHVGAVEDIVVTVKDIRSNTGSDNTIVIVVGCLAAVAVLAAIVGLIMWKKSNGYGRTSTKDSDSENSDQPLPQATGK